MAKSAVQLVVDGTAVSQFKCKIFRNELDPKEFSNRNIGFMGTLPPQYWTGGKYSVSLVEPSSGTILHQAEVKTSDSRLVAIHR